MKCARCNKDFPEAELKAPPRWLRWAALPGVFLMGRMAASKETFAVYCYPCRRSFNAALFFIVAMIVIAGLAWGIKEFIPEEIRHANANKQKLRGR
jgi:hypothetical protein